MWRPLSGENFKPVVSRERGMGGRGKKRETGYSKGCRREERGACSAYCSAVPRQWSRPRDMIEMWSPVEREGGRSEWKVREGYRR